MSKIRILDPALANMIAAGEVVERPSSVVKELVENSIDAMAKNIDIYIKNAGRTLIMIKDDGTGMDKEDAILAFKRHATSKIFNQQSLFRIESLGFRGEAVPSISAVSIVTMETSTGEGVGTKVVSHPNKELELSYCSARKGTMICVEELFYNTPARLKHLRSDYTEVANIQEVVTKLALGHSDIAFNLYVDDRKTFSTSGNGKILEIIATIYGVESAKQMEYIELENNDFRVTGYISKIGLTKASRYYITTLLNGRNVRMNTATNALLDAYKTFIPVDRFPISVLNIETDPSLVDVNVHPSKQEVRVSKEESLVNLLKEGVKNKLSSLIMNVTLDKKSIQGVKVIQPQLNLDVEVNPYINKKVEDIPVKAETINEYLKVEDKKIDNLPLKEEYKELIPKDLEEVKDEETPSAFLLKLTVVGQIHGTYIVATSDDGFYLIDQHAAMERVNYEYFSKMLADNKYVTPLLIPIVIELSISEINLLKDKLNLLDQIGIKAEIFGNNALRIVEVPTWMSNVNVKIYCEDMIDFILKRNSSRVTLREEAIMTLACKASLKANKALTMEDMQVILSRLAKCQNPHSCPHGRPTMVFYSTYSIEKAFKRVG
jgi:DNA mismatch repair protein MutL